MRRYLLLLLLLTLLLAGCRRVPADPTEPVSGWKDEGNQTYYINKDGSIHVGWLELDGKRPPESQDMSPHIRLTPGECETVAMLATPDCTARAVTPG